MKIKKVEVVFYKSNYKWWSRLIKWFTRSKYSHCELYINDKGLLGISEEQNVRYKEQSLNADKWDRIELKVDPLLEWTINNFYENTHGLSYDWKAIILTHLFKFKKHNPNKYTCSEWVVELLDNRYHLVPTPKEYFKYTPQDVYNLLAERESKNGK